MARILLFASAKDRAGKSEVTIKLREPISLEALLVLLLEKIKHPDKNLFNNANYLYSVNSEIQPLSKIIEDGDEIGVLPPMSGG